jgi:hypothetical protein
MLQTSTVTSEIKWLKRAGGLIVPEHPTTKLAVTD